nr:hypothetical protein [Tanacetum cinerariifolium]
MENYKNVSQDIRDQLNTGAEAIQIILTGIDNDIYSIVDACPNACEMWKAIERLKQGESINVQDRETDLYWEFGKFTSRDGESLKLYYSKFYKMMNELVRNQCDVTNHQVNVQFLLQLQPEWQRIKRYIDSKPNHELIYYSLKNPPYKFTWADKEVPISEDEEPSMVAEDDEMSKDKEIDKLMALISLSFKKIYKPTNNNLRTSSNTSRANQDNSLRINSGVSKGMSKPKRENDAAYHREKMLLCKPEEAVIQLNAEQADWRDGTDDESEDQELEAHYMFLAQIQKVSPDATDSGPIFDSEPLQKVSNDDNYNVFSIESQHPEQSKSVHDTYPIVQDEHNMIIDSLDMSYDREQIDQNDDDDDLANEQLKKKLSAHQETISILSQEKEAQIELYKTREDKELDKVFALENKFKVLDNIVYKTGQSVQTMNMFNNKCRTSFAKHEFLKKAQRANPRLYDIGCYNDNVALMLAPESNEVICLEKES